MMTKCKFCGEDIFYKEKGHGKGVCNKKNDDEMTEADKKSLRESMEEAKTKQSTKFKE